MKCSARWVRFGVPLLSGAFGLLWFLANEGGQKIVPTWIGWAMQGDWGQHLLGWEMFRRAPWGFPLGKLPNLAAPMGTFVGYTDANPWVAVLLKPFSAWLPADFQYVGPFMALSFVLMGVFGALAVRQLSRRAWIQVLGGALFALSPVLLHREGHDTLTAQWLIVALLWLYLRPAEDASALRRTLGWMLAFNAIAAGVHPTLAAMVLALSLALLGRVALDGTLRPAELAGWGAALVTVVLGVFALLGYFTVRDRQGRDFGRFSADLLTLINPADTSNWLPGIPRGPGQYEGYGYLGLSVLALGAVSLAAVLVLRRRLAGRPLPRLWPLAVAVCLMAVFSLSSQVTVAGKEVLSLERLYAPIAAWVTPFRSSGRFIWPLAYLLLLLSLAGVLRAFERWPRWLTAGLALVVAGQVLELGHWKPRFEDTPDWGQFRSPTWTLAQGHYRTLALYPTVLFNGDWRGCTSDFGLGDVLRAGHEAYRLGLRFNSMYLSRADWDAMMRTCDVQNADVRAGRFAPDTVYLIAPSRLGELRPFAAQLACGVLDRHVVCVRASNHDPFRSQLGPHSP